MKNLIGFRQFLKSPHSYEDLKKLLFESQKIIAFDRQDTSFFIAVCGENPLPFLQQKNLLSEVQFFDYSAKRFSPTQLVKNIIADVVNGAPIKIFYYSVYPEGLTYPIDLFTQLAVFLNFDHLGVSDSDFQIPFREIMKSLEFHIQNADAKYPTVTFPKRVRRSLDAENYPINRWAMEDIENLYVYFLSNIKFLEEKLDIQSGLFFTNRPSNVMLDFNKVGKWVGTLHVAISLLRHPDIRVFQNQVETNVQHESSINFQVQCRKINELYDYYLIPMENIIRIATDNPKRYLMNDWTTGYSKKEIEQALARIFQAYQDLKHQ